MQPDDSQQYYDIQSDLLKNQLYSEFQQVIPNLYIGGQISLMKFAKLKEHNIKWVIKANGIKNEFPLDHLGVKVKVFDFDDTPDFEIYPFFEQTSQYIQQGIDRNEGVLVVCTAGISRSATVVMGYLVKQFKMQYEEAFKKVKKARIYVKPNKGFEEQLKTYASQVNCDLCCLTPRTEWFPQYCEMKGRSQSFLIFMCDQCDGPVVVYVKGHKQDLDHQEYAEAGMIAERFGNDYYGKDNWYIDSVQRTIPDHFHWHIRPKEGNSYYNVLSGFKEITLESLEKKNIQLNELKQASKDLVSLHLQRKSYHVQDYQVQYLADTDSSCPFTIVSSVKLMTKFGHASITQKIQQKSKVVARVHLSINTKKDQKNALLGKL